MPNMADSFLVHEAHSAWLTVFVLAVDIFIRIILLWTNLKC